MGCFPVKTMEPCITWPYDVNALLITRFHYHHISLFSVHHLITCMLKHTTVFMVNIRASGCWSILSPPAPPSSRLYRCFRGRSATSQFERLSILEIPSQQQEVLLNILSKIAGYLFFRKNKAWLECKGVNMWHQNIVAVTNQISLHLFHRKDLLNQKILVKSSLPSQNSPPEVIFYQTRRFQI